MHAIENIKVLDLTRVIAGPLAGQMLADLGADVIKVERPLKGDDVRHLGPPWLKDKDGNELKEATYFSAVNRGKKSITVDFSKPEGAELIRSLAARMDIFIENYKPGSLEKYGLDYATLSKLNPKLIYCSVSAFGHTGPYRKRAGYDFLMQGLSGMMSVTGRPGSGPTRAGVPIVDYSAGQNAVIGVLAALNFRNRTGKGQHVDVALFDSQVAMMLNVFSAWFNSGVLIKQTSDHPSACPHGVFPTADGHIIIATMSDFQFVKLADLLGHPEWASDPRFAINSARIDNYDLVLAMMSEALQKHSSEYWIKRLDEANIPAGPINKISDLEDDPQLEAREMVVNMPDEQVGEYRMAGNPVKLSESPVQYRLPPPKLGQHTVEVLTHELNLSAERLKMLHEKEII